MRILIIEDERDLNNVISKHLKKQGYSTDSAFDGEEGLDFLQFGAYNLIILDVMMPKLDGYGFLQKIREKNDMTPVLMLTAKSLVEHKVKALDLGADDYLVKPFDFEELLARVRAMIRRHHGNVSNDLKVDDLVLNIANKSVTRDGLDIDLTGKEYEILEYLLQNKNRIISREQIKDNVWGFEYEGESNVIDVLIKNIRKKIDVGRSQKTIIHTKRGLGYVVKE